MYLPVSTLLSHVIIIVWVFVSTLLIHVIIIVWVLKYLSYNIFSMHPCTKPYPV
jgi:uncharacterized membrane protein AbrB (regulator of aidB expression)